MLDSPFVLSPASFLGELIASRRLELGQSQRELADLFCAASGRSTVTRHEISRYEREVRTPAGSSIGPLAAALDLPTFRVRQAAEFTKLRRHLFGSDPDGLIDASPGWLFNLEGGQQPRSMLFVGDSE